MSSFDLTPIQIEFKFWSAEFILLSEVSNVWSKSNHANELNTLANESEKDVKRANAVCEGKKHSENLTFSAFAVWTNVKQNRAPWLFQAIEDRRSYNTFISYKKNARRRNNENWRQIDVKKMSLAKFEHQHLTPL